LPRVASGCRVAIPRQTPVASKRHRIQVYLKPEQAEAVRKRAAEEGCPESREVTRLVALGLSVDARPYAIGGRSFRTLSDVEQHIEWLCNEARHDAADDPVLRGLLQLHPDYVEGQEDCLFVPHGLNGEPLNLCRRDRYNGRLCYTAFNWRPLLALIPRQ